MTCLLKEVFYCSCLNFDLSFWWSDEVDLPWAMPACRFIPTSSDTDPSKPAVLMSKGVTFTAMPKLSWAHSLCFLDGAIWPGSTKGRALQSVKFNSRLYSLYAEYEISVDGDILKIWRKVPRRNNDTIWKDELIGAFLYPERAWCHIELIPRWWWNPCGWSRWFLSWILVMSRTWRSSLSFWWCVTAHETISFVTTSVWSITWWRLRRLPASVWRLPWATVWIRHDSLYVCVLSLYANGRSWSNATI